jgi:hypothetical protein
MEDNFKTTTSHTVIRAWAESHGGKPALIVDPNKLDTAVGLRIDFPGNSDEALLSASHRNKDVSWDEFFAVFEAQQLAFSYLPKLDGTDLVDAFMFLKREAIKEKDSATPFDPDEFAKAIRDDEPAFFTHDGKEENPQQREVLRDVSEDELGEGQLGGSSIDQDSDDDTTQAVADLGIVDPEDEQAKHDRQ